MMRGKKPVTSLKRLFSQPGIPIPSTFCPTYPLPEWTSLPKIFHLSSISKTWYANSPTAKQFSQLASIDRRWGLLRSGRYVSNHDPYHLLAPWQQRSNLGAAGIRIFSLPASHFAMSSLIAERRILSLAPDRSPGSMVESRSLYSKFIILLYLYLDILLQ